MLGERGCEDNERRVLEAPQHIGAEQPRHLHVEEHELRPQCVNPGDCGLAVGRLADDVHPVERTEHRAQACARDRLIVYDKSRDLHASLSRWRGTTSSASNPPSPWGRHSSRAALPYSTPSRSRSRASPVPVPDSPGRTAPLPLEFRTESVISDALPAAATTISVAATLGAAPCRTAFSTRVCIANAGTRSSSRLSAMSVRTRRRSPKRIRSTAR